MFSKNSSFFEGLWRMFSNNSRVSKILEKYWQKKLNDNRRILEIFKKKCKASKDPWRMFSKTPCLSKVTEKYWQKNLTTIEGSWKYFPKNLSLLDVKILSKIHTLWRFLKTFYFKYTSFQAPLKNLQKKNNFIESSWF